MVAATATAGCASLFAIDDVHYLAGAATDAGGPWCASQTGYKVCSDFEESPNVASGWARIGSTPPDSGGAIALDKSTGFESASSAHGEISAEADVTGIFLTYFLDP